jgi:hypothetical protein
VDGAYREPAVTRGAVVDEWTIKGNLLPCLWSCASTASRPPKCLPILPTWLPSPYRRRSTNSTIGIDEDPSPCRAARHVRTIVHSLLPFALNQAHIGPAPAYNSPPTSNRYTSRGKVVLVTGRFVGARLRARLGAPDAIVAHTGG